MVRSAALALLLLASCDNAPKTWTRDEIQDIADDATDENSARIDALQKRVDDLETEIAGQKAYTRSLAGTADTIADQVANNAKVANENVLKDATDRGACGYEQVLIGNGPGTVTRNIPCTAETYFHKK